MGVKLWHDDVRPAPEGWVWARTNRQAIQRLVCGIGPQGEKSPAWVEEISMDHDLGLHELDPVADPGAMFRAGPILCGDGCGCDLAKFIARTDWQPEKITIHSWNPIAARKMATILNDAGLNVYVTPFMPTADQLRAAKPVIDTFEV